MRKPFLILILIFQISSLLFGQQNSVLSSGDWYKLGVSNNGIYQLSYSDLQDLNIQLTDLDINSIKIYGNGGGMLPHLNSDFRDDDLEENAVFVYDYNNNGYFNSDDYVLFYGESPHEWVYNASTNLFDYKDHLYSDECYYFLTIDQSSAGKRINYKPQITNYTRIINSFNDYKFHESNFENLIESGRDWYGERFGILDNQTFTFNFSDLILNHPIYITTSVAARSLNSSFFNVNINSDFISNINISNIVYDYATEYAKRISNTHSYISNSDQLDIELKYNYSENNAIGWLDRIELNARRSLRMNTGFLNFRDVESVGSSELGKFEIKNSNASTIVWDVTDPKNVKMMNTNLNGSILSFIDSISFLNHYCAFNNSFVKPNLLGRIENQNLHNISLDVNYAIISHPSFLSEANRLLEIHEYYDNLNSIVVTPQQIYNEFSSGMQDVVAIRDFLKLLYKRQNSKLEYALLFGDGSYDNKNRIANNTNFIPTFQSENSLSPVASFVTDDFFALLDDDDGDLISDLVDIGIGR